jgi:hypothetical protein
MPKKMDAGTIRSLDLDLPVQGIDENRVSGDGGRCDGRFHCVLVTQHGLVSVTMGSREPYDWLLMKEASASGFLPK